MPDLRAEIDVRLPPPETAFDAASVCFAIKRISLRSARLRAGAAGRRHQHDGERGTNGAAFSSEFHSSARRRKTSRRHVAVGGVVP
jgi:hypothetical protein